MKGLTDVLMIVVGVLIALGVNEIRENIRERKIEKLYIERLILDLEINKKAALNLAQWQDRIVENSRRVYPLVKYGKRNEFNDVSIIAQAYHASAGPTPTWVNDTFEELKSTGNFVLIRNYNVRTAILGYYRFLDTEDYPFQIPSYEFRDVFRKKLDPEIQLKIRSESSLEDSISNFDPGDFDTVSFIKWMSKNEELAEQLTRVITQAYRASNEFLSKVSLRTDEMITLITLLKAELN